MRHKRFDALTRAAGVILAFVVVAVAAAPANAILDGTPDVLHPYVGLVYTDDGFCTGSAISSTVFLTAGHCVPEEGTVVFVSFSEDPQPRDTDGWPLPEAAQTTGYAEKISDVCDLAEDLPCPPGLPGFFSSSDVGVVYMDKPVDLPSYAELPEPGQVQTLKTGAQLTAVGYGVDTIVSAGGMMAEPVASITRKSTTLQLLPSPRAIDEVTMRAFATRQQGMCQGDSGSPLLQDDTVLGVLSGSTGFCQGSPAYYARVDNDMLPLLEELID